jgi:hypothetical protein
MQTSPSRASSSNSSNENNCSADFLEQATSTGLGWSLPVVRVFLVTLPFIAAFLHVVGVRALASDPESRPTSEVLFENVGRVYVPSPLSNFVAWVLIAIALVLAVITGLVLAVITGLVLAVITGARAGAPLSVRPAARGPG